MDKFCVNCKYHLPAMVTLCKHPRLGLSPVTGESRSQFASTIRFNYIKCGPEGKWFEEKLKEVKPVKWWNKLLGWKN